MQEGRQPSEEGAGKTAVALRTPFVEFVALTALLMALTALSIDIMLPSLPQIGEAFSISHPNDRQQVVTSYMLGLAFGQLFWGPLSDRFGRKRLLLIGLSVFVSGSIACLLVGSFPLLLAARTLQGFGGASARVISVAIVRDLFVGRQMARVMSIVMMVFITVPIFAPTVGQGLAHIGSWRWPFGVLLFAGLAGMLWAGYRLTETARAAGHKPPGVSSAAATVLTTPTTVAYTAAWGLMFGCLVTYISSAQQIFVDVYDLGAAFPIAFGAVACAMALASFTNSRLVHRLGMRRVSHSALVSFVVASLLLSLISFAGRPPLMVFGLLLAACFFCFGLIVPNFNAIAMQPMGAVAGTAASLIGFSTTATGAAIGWMVGRLFDGTVRPLVIGFAALGLLASACVLLVEGRRGLFRGE
jgi:DHA1 family bicyclomycin/chloramphenicol resistance-like MFS transporter